MSFQVPLSSSPMAPSTPGSEKKRNKQSGVSNSFGSNISTTPAGLPPSSAGSFTPAGPPPSSVFGSSQLGSGKTLFKGKAKVSPIPKSDMDSSKLARFLGQSSNFNLRGGNDSAIKGALALPDSSPPSRHYEDEDADEEEEEDYDDEDVEDYSEEDDHSYGVALDRRITAIDHYKIDQSPSAVRSKVNGVQSLPLEDAPSVSDVPSTTGATANNAEGFRGLTARDSVSGIETESQGIARPKSYAPTIAQDLSRQLGAAPLEESDEFILGTEEHINALYTAFRNGSSMSADARASTLSDTCERLCNLWRTDCDRDARKAPWKDEVIIGIGPDESAPGAHSATFLSTLLLSLHHPAAATGGQALASSRLGRSTQSSMIPYSTSPPLNPTAYPKILFDWLDQNHNPYKAILAEVRNHKPNPTAHEYFWDVIYKLVLRGRFAELLMMLKEANFRFASTAKEDGHKENGYGRTQVDNIDVAVKWAVQALQTCPALTDDNWQVQADTWTTFRKNIQRANDTLIKYAEGRDKDLDSEDPGFEASNFGLKSSRKHLSRSSRRAESKVPWTILRNLKTLYGMLLGGSLEIMSYSENWVESSIALTALWNGEDSDAIITGSRAMAKRSPRTSRSRGSRLVDTDPGVAYRRRLAETFSIVIEGPDGSEDPPMLPDTSKPLEVALSSIFEGDIVGAVSILRALSLPISDAVAEIGTFGGWLQAVALETTMDGFDDEDMDLLSFEKNAGSVRQPNISRNLIMKDYAEELFNKKDITGKRGVVVKGWELSIAVLARMDMGTGASSRKEIREVLNRLPLNSDAQIDKILHICYEHGIPGEGRKLVEQYASTVLDNSDDYGTALIYYARAHSRKKIKGVLDLLISYSLVQSTAYPASTSLDPNLHSLVSAPQESLEHLALLDIEGAAILHKALTGYATLRKFYDLRDSFMNRPDGQSPIESPLSLKKEAAAAILALVNSAADSIHGGLYDSHIKSIVHVDGLLTLLGEALVFVNQSPPLLTRSQAVSLLSAIEDLSTAPSAIFHTCDEFLRSTLVAYGHRPLLASPRQMLKKQMSSITTSGSSFSLVGSSLLDSQLVDAMDVDSNINNNSSANSSRALTKSNEDVKRGWDWRKGLDDGATGEDVIRILRLGLAKEIAGHWMREGGVS